MARGGAVVRTPVRTARESQSSSASKPSSTPPPAPAVMGVDIDVRGVRARAPPASSHFKGWRSIVSYCGRSINELMRI
jgi:hypothetical protein